MDIPIIKENRLSLPIQESTPKPSKIQSQSNFGQRLDPIETPWNKACPIDHERAIHALTERLNQFMKSSRFNLQFIPDQEAGGVVIKVYDGNGNLIRRIPPEVMELLSSEFGDHIGILLNAQL